MLILNFKEYGEPGFPIPIVDGVSFVNPELLLGQVESALSLYCVFDSLGCLLVYMCNYRTIFVSPLTSVTILLHSLGSEVDQKLSKLHSDDCDLFCSRFASILVWTCRPMVFLVL